MVIRSSTDRFGKAIKLSNLIECTTSPLAFFALLICDDIAKIRFTIGTSMIADMPLMIGSSRNRSYCGPRMIHDDWDRPFLSRTCITVMSLAGVLPKLLVLAFYTFVVNIGL